MDSRLEVFDEAGALVALDDDSGSGFCAAAVDSSLAAGRYHVAVSGAGATFQYKLRVRVLSALEDGSGG